MDSSFKVTFSKFARIALEVKEEEDEVGLEEDFKDEVGSRDEVDSKVDSRVVSRVGSNKVSLFSLSLSLPLF